MKNLQLIETYKKNHPLIYSDEYIQHILFLEAINSIKTEKPTMIELGVSDNPIYSKTFNEIFQNNCINICTDILERQIISAKKNFSNGIYYHCYSGEPVHCGENLPDPNNPLEKITNRISIKELMGFNNIKKIDILHSDIQGSETYLLQELKDDNLYDFIHYFFISVHSNYEECLNILKTVNSLEFLYSDSSKGGYGDGLIVCFNKNYEKQS